MTGPRHTRFLIASKMIEPLVERYSKMEVVIKANHFDVEFTFPGHYILSESVLREWCNILEKYKRIHYSVEFKDEKWKVTVA